MTDTARVGIVVRTKNRPWFLQRALRDIAAQDFSSWVVHVINDGGDHEDVDRAVRAAGDVLRDRIVVTHNSTAAGRSAAANQGIRSLKTEYVVLHDDDDLWDPRFLTETVAWLDSHPNHVGVVVRTDIVFEARSGSGDEFLEVGREPFWGGMKEVRYIDLLEVNRWVPIAYLYRRSLHDTVGYYDEDIHAAEDWDLGLRTLARFSVGYLDGRALAFWMHRRDVGGELGNSMFVLADEHELFGSRIRDAALRKFVAEYGAGLPLYIAGVIATERARLHSEIRDAVREELSRELDARPDLARRVWRKVRRLLRRA